MHYFSALSPRIDGHCYIAIRFLTLVGNQFWGWPNGGKVHWCETRQSFRSTRGAAQVGRSGTRNLVYNEPPFRLYVLQSTGLQAQW